MSVENMDRGNRITKVVQQEQPTSYIDNELMERTISNYSINPLFVFLTGIIGKEKTIVFSDYTRLAHQRSGAVLLYTGK